MIVKPTYSFPCQSCGMTTHADRIGNYCPKCGKVKKSLGTSLPIPVYQAIVNHRSNVSQFIVQAINEFLGKDIEPPPQHFLNSVENEILELLRENSQLRWNEILEYINQRRSVIRKTLERLVSRKFVAIIQEGHDNPLFYIKKLYPVSDNSKKSSTIGATERKALSIVVPVVLYDEISEIASDLGETMSFILREAVTAKVNRDFGTNI